MKSHKIRCYCICFLTLAVLVWIFFTEPTQEGILERHQVEVVVAHYSENMSWLNDDPFQQYNATVYVKSHLTPEKEQELRTLYPSIQHVIPLDNVGRESHTYLYHVVSRYDSLAEYTFFVPGSLNLEHKKHNGLMTEEQMRTNETTVLGVGKNDGLYDAYKDFTLDKWTSSDSENRENNGESDLKMSEIRPFGDWYKHHFGDLHVETDSLYGVLAVSKKDILSHPKEYYETFLKELAVGSNPEVGHYFERAWGAVFHS